MTAFWDWLRQQLQSCSCNHGGLTPPALVPAKMLSCIAKVAFSPPSERRAPGAAGVSPPWLWDRACEDNSHTFADDCRTRNQERRAVRPPAELRLFRCTNEQSAPGAAGVSPPCVALTYLHRRYRSCSAHCRPACWRSGCNRVRATTGAITPPALVRAPFARRRNCDLCDVQTNNQR